MCRSHPADGVTDLPALCKDHHLHYKVIFTLLPFSPGLATSLQRVNLMAVVIRGSDEELRVPCTFLVPSSSGAGGEYCLVHHVPSSVSAQLSLHTEGFILLTRANRSTGAELVKTLEHNLADSPK